LTSSVITCLRCELEKPVSEFHRTKRRATGYQPYCKECRREYAVKNKEAIKEKNRNRYLKNKDKVLQRNKEWRNNNPDKVKAQSRRHYVRHYEYIKERRKKTAEWHREYHKKYMVTNRISLKIKKRIYYEKNKEEILKCYQERIRVCEKRMSKLRLRAKLYRRRRMAEDIPYRLKSLIRGRMRTALLGKNKWGSAVANMGCTAVQLKEYLESKFYPHPKTGEQMSWSNHGLGFCRWQLDHVKELRFFDLEDPAQFKEACHFTNLQPLWHEDHVEKTWGNGAHVNREAFRTSL